MNTCLPAQTNAPVPAGRWRFVFSLPLICACLLGFACSHSSAEETRFRQILSDQLARYPRMQVPDLYKFIHQAAMGSEHAVQDTTAARAWLEREIAHLEEGPPDPQVDTLSPDGCLVRIHLRPYLARGGDPNALLAAFIRTANEFPADTTTLVRYWSWAETMAGDGELPFQPEYLRNFLQDMRALGFPAVHHSENYTRAYRPAYRVVAYDFLFPQP